MTQTCRSCRHDKAQHYYFHTSSGGYDTGCKLDDCGCGKFRR